jgi:hypothetical protein
MIQRRRLWRQKVKAQMRKMSLLYQFSLSLTHSLRTFKLVEVLLVVSAGDAP